MLVITMEILGAVQETLFMDPDLSILLLIWTKLWNRRFPAARHGWWYRRRFLPDTAVSCLEAGCRMILVPTIISVDALTT